MKTHITVQAAVVTMLVAKRPALAKLPLRWELRGDGSIRVQMELHADQALVPQAAAELARAMRGAREETYDMPENGGTVTRGFQVEGQTSGVRVEFHCYQRGLRVDEGAAAAEGGEVA
ncbi:hypothetical protein ACIHFC_29040 [Streptomyces sp. NPDC052013]|uniref:hypothetical protein n=1 Tax=Streptomyces sp. NPDC052013 TaxID=3365679 RepID=UPI0037D09CBD